MNDWRTIVAAGAARMEETRKPTPNEAELQRAYSSKRRLDVFTHSPEGGKLVMGAMGETLDIWELLWTIHPDGPVLTHVLVASAARPSGFLARVNDKGSKLQWPDGTELTPPTVWDVLCHVHSQAVDAATRAQGTEETFVTMAQVLADRIPENKRRAATPEPAEPRVAHIPNIMG